MKTRDQAEAGDDDPTKTVRLDDIYRFQFECRRESGDSEQAARPRVHMPSASNLLEAQSRLAESALNSALAEFKTAAAAVIDRIKAGEYLPKPELDREWNARLQLIEARQRVERLGHLRKAPQKTSG